MKKKIAVVICIVCLISISLVSGLLINNLHPADEDKPASVNSEIKPLDNGRPYRSAPKIVPIDNGRPY